MNDEMRGLIIVCGTIIVCMAMFSSCAIAIG